MNYCSGLLLLLGAGCHFWPVREGAAPAPAVLSPAPRQLSIPFDPARLRGMPASERRVVLTRLAGLLLEAADIAAEETDDDQR
jgi:hypothetical protein